VLTNHQKQLLDFVSSSLPAKQPLDTNTEFYELRDLKDADSVAAAISNLNYRYSYSMESTRKIFMYSIEVLRKFSVANK
jgi:hypothetical protein